MTHVAQVLNQLALAIQEQGGAIEWCGVDSTGTAMVRATRRDLGRSALIGWQPVSCTWEICADRRSHSTPRWTQVARLYMVVGLTSWPEVARAAAQYLRTGRLTLGVWSEEVVEARRQERRAKRERKAEEIAIDEG